MEIKDFFITPIVVAVVYALAYFVRPWVTEPQTKRYFIPGLTLKIVGGLAVGFIYQFYYGGGDTFTYFQLGSKYIWEAFRESPDIGIKLLFAGQDYVGETFKYASKIYTYGDLSSYFVVRVAGFFDLLTYHTYSATAVLFAVSSFSGLWALFHVLYRMYPDNHLGMAISVFFIPSVFFWGSGILKDTITLSALGWATYGIYYIFMAKRQRVLAGVMLALSFYTIYTIKIYILLCFLPAAILWVFYMRVKSVKNVILKIMVAPFILFMAGAIGYYAVLKVGEDNPRYDMDKIAETARVTAEWIHYVSQREGGSAYTLGDFDYSPAGMIKKFPLAVWVTLYRPYLWETRNVVMLFSALEALALFLFTLFVLYKGGLIGNFRAIVSDPFLIFCFVFSIIFAFAVGISTYNFGSLARYKIPLYPYFISGLIILLGYSKKRTNLSELEITE